MRRNWKRVLALWLSIAMVLTMNCSVFADPTFSSIDEETMVSVNAEEEKNVPEGWVSSNWAHGTLTFSSLNNEYAAGVSSWTFSGVDAGKATLTLTGDKNSKTFHISVNRGKAESATVTVEKAKKSSAVIAKVELGKEKFAPELVNDSGVVITATDDKAVSANIVVANTNSSNEVADGTDIYKVSNNALQKVGNWPEEGSEEGRYYFFNERYTELNWFEVVKSEEDNPLTTISWDGAVKKTTSYAKSVDISLKDGITRDNIAFLALSVNAASESVSKNFGSDELWTQASEDPVELSEWVSSNGVKRGEFKPGEKYYLYVGLISENNVICVDGPKEVETEEYNELSVNLTGPSSALTYVGQKKGISDNFSFSFPTGKKADVKQTEIKFVNKENANALYVKNEVPSTEGVVRDISENNVPSGNYVAVAYATISENVANNYEYGVISSNAVEFQVTQAKAKVEVTFSGIDGVTKVKNGQILAGQYLEYDDLYTYVNDTVNNSKKTLGLEGDVVYKFNDSKSQVLTKGKNVSFNQAGTIKITVSLNGAKLTKGTKDGNLDGENPNNYLALTESDMPSIELEVVEAPKKGYTIAATGEDVFYEAAQDDFAKNEPGVYFTVAKDGTNISETGYKNVTYTYMTVSNGNLRNYVDVEGKEKIKAGATIYVSANYYLPGMDKTSGNTATYATIKVAASPVVISMNETLKSNKGEDLKTSYSKDTGTITVEVLDRKGNTVSEGDIKKTLSDKGAKVDEIFKTPSLNIVTGTINKNIAKTYDYVITSYEISTGNDKFNRKISENYIIGSVTGKYQVINKINVAVINADTGEAISDKVAYASENSLTISAGSAGNPKTAKYYLKYSVAKGEQVRDISSYKKADLNPRNEVVFEGDFIEEFIKDYTGDNIEIFVHFVADPDKGDIATVVTKGTKDPTGSYAVEYITPVVFTGEKHVASDDTKLSGKKNNIADLVVNVKYGDTPLVYNVDYTLSYKNNVNAVNKDTAANKRPQIIVKGKGAHKGMKLTVEFSILPASFENIAVVQLKKPYVKLTGKVDVQKVATVYNRYTGKKLSGKFTFEAYDTKNLGTAITGKLPAGTSANVIEYYVRAKADKTGKNAKKNVNYNDNYTELEDVTLYGIPKISYKASAKTFVKTIKGYDGKSALSVNAFIKDGAFTKVSGGKKGNKLDASGAPAALEKSGVGVYFCDKNGEKSEVQSVSSAGTYYIAVGPLYENMASLASYGIFEPSITKVTLKGTSMKSAYKLDPAKEVFDGKAHDIVVTAKNASKVPLSTKIRATYLAPGMLDELDLGYLPASGKITGDEIVKAVEAATSDNKIAYDNRSAGKYTIFLTGTGEFEGTQKLTFTVTPAKAADITVKFSNGKDTTKLSYNAAGWYHDELDVKMGSTILTENRDYAVTYTGKAVGEGKGTAKITGISFKGSKTLKFDVEKMDLSGFAPYKEGTGQPNYYKMKDGSASASANKLTSADDLEGLYQSSATGVKQVKSTEYTASGNSITASESSKYYTGALKF